MGTCAEQQIAADGPRHGGHIKYLYHQTSKSAGPEILRHGFRRGHIGWCGGGIYFALSKGATYHKAEPRR